MHHKWYIIVLHRVSVLEEFHITIFIIVIRTLPFLCWVVDVGSLLSPLGWGRGNGGDLPTVLKPGLGVVHITSAHIPLVRTK